MAVPLMDLRGQWAELMPRAKQAVLDVIDSGRFILGPQVAAFERESAERLGVAHAIGVANGTDAIVLALRALGVEPGEEVICPAYTFYATAEAVAAAGAVPVFADIDPETYCLDAAAVEAAVTPRTRAVIAVHLFGHPADVDALRAVCARHDLALLEDAAQAFGARLGERCVGSLGDVATFSFFPTKNLSTFGDGGLLTTGDAALAEHLRRLRFHGSRDKRTFEEIGANSRLDELHAAILRVFADGIDGWNAARGEVARRYEALGLGRHVGLPPAGGVYHLYVVRCAPGARDGVLAACRAREVGAAVYYDVPLHLQPVFAHLGYAAGSLPETERASRECLALPMYVTLDEGSQRAVVDAVAAAGAAAA
jgi:dTDP-4-amino-4,6-dideoxygalactose transaminase